MGLICIARWSEARGKDLAATLASKLGHACYSREDMVEEATSEGIAVGKLETAMLKPHLFNERLVLEKEHYIAFATARLTGRALEEDLVYHGRTGHLLVPGVAHVLRVRVEEDLDERISRAMVRLKLPRSKARRYIEEVDQDVRRWVRTQYGEDWESNAQYDVVVNLDRLQVGNAAAALCTVAELPEFRPTPASRTSLANLNLAARVRMALARDDLTRTGRFRVTADRGSVLVTFRPQDYGLADSIHGVVVRVDGVREVHATLATSNLLWIQEEFDPSAESARQIIDLARSWNAAVDLLAVRPGAEETPEQGAATTAKTEYNGGIEDDDDTQEQAHDGGLEAMHDLLSREGVAGGRHVVRGSADSVSSGVDSQVKYMLVVLGNVFLDKGQATRTRLTRELASDLSDQMKAPVVGMDEIKRTYLFGPRQYLTMFGYLAVAAAIFVTLFTFQVPILRFLTAPETHGRAMAAVAIGLVVPVYAWCYGSFTKSALKLLRIE